MIVKLIYFFIPAYVANMTPVFVSKLNFLKIPVDFGKSHAGVRIFGENKTWRGLFFGIIFGFLAFLIQKWLFDLGYFHQISMVDYSRVELYLGFVMGSSALVGDLLESFIKRKLDIAAGHRWLPFDQIDFIALALIATYHWTNVTLSNAVILLFIVFFGTLAVQLIGTRTRLKSDI